MNRHTDSVRIRSLAGMLIWNRPQFDALGHARHGLQNCAVAYGRCSWVRTTYG